MQEFTSLVDDGFLWSREHEQVWITPWGADGVRVRVTRESGFRDLPQGLLPDPQTPSGAEVTIGESDVTLVHGAITVTLTGPRAQLAFKRTADGTTLLEEPPKTTAEHLARTFTPHGSTWKIDQRFFPYEGERLYGLGQRQHGFLDQKGCTMDLMHRNTEVSIPFMISNRGYGFLWNHPGLGRVALGRDDTRWTADAAHQLDYYVVAGETPAEILQRYAEVTGMPSSFPEWGAGFWQCKLRYKTQEELLTVAREYHRRGIPVSVMVIDFYHWTLSGDWSFDPAAWPDPTAMVEELRSMGMECMVSIWPTVDYESRNYEYMRDHGLVIRNERGQSVQNGAKLETFYDATNPKARTFLFEQVRKGYLEHGIHCFWLDTMEPEIIPLELDNTRFYLGNGREVSGLYPLCHQQGFFEGLTQWGDASPMTLGRSAWVGSQRFGAAVWSADIPSTFDSLRRQVTGGLSIGLSGIPWWTSDIGGFHGGDIEDPAFRELMIRWFQFGAFCPIMRLHGVRRHAAAKVKPGDPIGKADPHQPTVANEVWSFGDEACEILTAQIHLRERLRPYIMEQMKIAETTGLPPMRPLFLDYPEDERAWEIEDEFLFGPDILVAPILTLGARSRTVYLPHGPQWRNAWTGEMVAGGSTIEADAPLEYIPVFVKSGSGIELNE
jgi:alpha-D-xyloside xylohydrolase